MKSQKELAAEMQRDIAEKQKERIELGVIEEAKDELTRERLVNEAIIQEAIAEKGYIISVPDTEVILYEDDGILYAIVSVP